jgi:putative spermidine/putrescine transport system permease protein
MALRSPAFSTVGERMRGSRATTAVANGLIFSPAIVPVIVLAVGVYFVFSDLGLTASVPGLVIAHTMLALPFVVITVRTSLGAVDRRLEDAAASMGATPLRTFASVTLPLILPGIVAGALFAFITSWDEIVMAVFLTSPTFQTLPVVMFTQVQDYVDPTVAAAATIQFMVTTIGLAAVAVVITWRDRRLSRRPLAPAG